MLNKESEGERLDAKALSSEGLFPAELARLLAEKVMGWPVSRDYEEVGLRVIRHEGQISEAGDSPQVLAPNGEAWEPVRRLDHAWMLIEQLRSRGPAARRAVFESLRPVLLDPVPAEPARLVHAVLHLVEVEREGQGVEVAFDEAQRAEDRRRERIDKPAASLISDLAFHLEDQRRERETWSLRLLVRDGDAVAWFEVLTSDEMWCAERCLSLREVAERRAPGTLAADVAAAYEEIR